MWGLLWGRELPDRRVLVDRETIGLSNDYKHKKIWAASRLKNLQLQRLRGMAEQR